MICAQLHNSKAGISWHDTAKLCQTLHMLDCSLVSDNTMSIMPSKSASAHICCRFCHDIPRIMPYAHSPHGTNILPYSHLISIGVLNGVMRMSGSIPPGHSGQINLSTVLYCRESPTTAADLSFRHCGTLLQGLVPSWRQPPLLCIMAPRSASADLCRSIVIMSSA